ncbi:MAG: DEAD/DEAH box helicase, partial [Actinomycetota bacterium]|nr:DEAD/DEAH box helicase [Actinomycetota bacterium]
PHLYQRIDVEYAVAGLAAGGAYLGWEPGLGKTLGACMAADASDCNFILAVCPNSAKHRTWAPAVKLMPWLGEPLVIGNSKAARERALAEAAERMDAGTPTLVICHYEALGLVDWAPLGVLDLIIFDEAHRLKNPKAGFVKAATKIPACGRLMLSGSVLDGDIEDLFVPWKAMRPSRYRRRWADWNDRFVDYAEGDFGKISLGARPHRIPELREELGELLTVRRAADELDIPAAHTERVSLALLPVQRRAYDSLVEDLFAELPDGDIITAQQGAGLISKLRGVTGGVPLPDEGYASSKLDYIEELLDLKGAALGVGGRPLQSVVFFWHKEPANRLAARLGPLAAVVHGDVPNKLREERVEAFAQGQVRVLIATFATLSESVNLQMAGRVILGEHSWKPLHNDQAIDRVVRQGQTAHASVVHVTAADTVDELRVLPVIKSKTMLRQLVLGR